MEKLQKEKDKADEEIQGLRAALEKLRDKMFQLGLLFFFCPFSFPSSCLFFALCQLYHSDLLFFLSPFSLPFS
jgi:hypothetical protein